VTTTDGSGANLVLCAPQMLQTRVWLELPWEAMEGSWPAEAAGAGCSHGLKRLRRFSLDNVTAGGARDDGSCGPSRFA
jgi:hypothetical protein